MKRAIFAMAALTLVANTFRPIMTSAIGDVVSCQTTYHGGTLSKRPRKPEWSDLEFQMRNWWHFTWISGDHIVEQAIHSIDRLAWATGDRQASGQGCYGEKLHGRSNPNTGRRRATTVNNPLMPSFTIAIGIPAKASSSDNRRRWRVRSSTRPRRRRWRGASASGPARTSPWRWG